MKHCADSTSKIDGWTKLMPVPPIQTPRCLRLKVRIIDTCFLICSRVPVEANIVRCTTVSHTRWARPHSKTMARLPKGDILPLRGDDAEPIENYGLLVSYEVSMKHVSKITSNRYLACPSLGDAKTQIDVRT